MAIHAAMIDRMDREIGRVLARVKTMKAWENTVVFFVSDNGASAEQIIRGDGHDPAAPPGSAKTYLCLGPGWSTAANTPLRLHKSWVHEGGIASPLIVHWPAGISSRGAWRRAPGHFIDLLPTVLELAGAAAPGAWHGAEPPPLPGKSLVPAFAQDVPLPRDYLYWHHLNNRALRVGDWKIVSAGGKQEGPWELYDVAADRGEQNNLAPPNPIGSSNWPSFGRTASNSSDAKPDLRRPVLAPRSARRKRRSDGLACAGTARITPSQPHPPPTAACARLCSTSGNTTRIRVPPPGSDST